MRRRIRYVGGTVYEWDEGKAVLNREKHGVRFERLGNFEWNTSRTVDDDRRDYGERRHVTYGTIEDRLHVLVWTARAGNVRVISLRKANRREKEFYYGSVEENPDT